MIHHILLELQRVIVIISSIALAMLLKRYLLELLLAAAQALVRLLTVLLHFGAKGLLIGVAFHVVVESTYAELGTAHQGVLVVSNDGLSA